MYEINFHTKISSAWFAGHSIVFSSFSVFWSTWEYEIKFYTKGFGRKSTKFFRLRKFSSFTVSGTQAPVGKRRDVEKIKKTYNQRAKDLKRMAVGDTVPLQPKDRGGLWTKAVVERQNWPRSYDLAMGNGTRIRRNRRHLRKTKEDFQLKDEDEWESDCEVQTSQVSKLTAWQAHWLWEQARNWRTANGLL